MLVITEFGRTVHVNGTGGHRSRHGRGGVRARAVRWRAGGCWRTGRGWRRAAARGARPAAEHGSAGAGEGAAGGASAAGAGGAGAGVPGQRGGGAGRLADLISERLNRLTGRRAGRHDFGHAGPQALAARSRYGLRPPVENGEICSRGALRRGNRVWPRTRCCRSWMCAGGDRACRPLAARLLRARGHGAGGAGRARGGARPAGGSGRAAGRSRSGRCRRWSRRVVSRRKRAERGSRLGVGR